MRGDARTVARVYLSFFSTSPTATRGQDPFPADGFRLVFGLVRFGFVVFAVDRSGDSKDYRRKREHRTGDYIRSPHDLPKGGRNVAQIARFQFPMLRSGVWLRHPSLLWHYPASVARHLRAVKSAAPVQAEFEKNAADGQFAERWFDVNIIPWHAALSRVFNRTDPLDILEIGSWEGRSTLFLATYFPHAQITAVDTWAGNAEYEYTTTGNLSDLEARFDHNLSPAVGRVTKHKGLSSFVLPQLVSDGRRFDLIYVDGSHFADDVLSDALAAWRMLPEGGVVIFDDFLWNGYPRRRANPVWAIGQFLKYHAGEYRILGAYYQIIVQKTAAPVDRPRGESSS